MLLSYLMTIKSVGGVTWAVFFLYVVQRVWVSAANMYILSNNDQQYHGRVLAFVSLLTAAAALLQPVLTKSIEYDHGKDYGLLNWWMFAVSGGSLIFPVLIYIEKYVKSCSYGSVY